MPGIDPEAYLDSLEPIGWKLGLERMQRLCALLGMPQHRFASIHVVGTNGKSSVTRMIAALLEAHGLAAGASISPHASRWSERILIRGSEISGPELAAAVGQAAEAAEAVNRSLEEGDAVTQFELATAAAFLALASAGVEVGVIEAGLGGRLDASNTIPSQITVLTSIGLDHTEWLGETEAEIAAEKLAVLRDLSTLVVGAVGDEVLALAERAASERGAELIRAAEDPGREVRLSAPGRFQRRNFALAMAVAEAFLGRLDPEGVRGVASSLSIPGRLEKIAEDPPIYLDAAHNLDGAGALAESLPELAEGRPVVAILAMLADKDAEGMVAALAPAIERAVCTELPGEALAARGLPGAASRPAAELAEVCAAAGVPAEAEADLGSAIRRAGAIAAGPPPGALLVTGSHYILAPARALLR